jgi:hypothetical protein
MYTYSHIYKIYNFETFNMVAIAIWNRFLAGHSVLDSWFLIRHPPLKQEVTRLVAKQEFQHALLPSKSSISSILPGFVLTRRLITYT